MSFDMVPQPHRRKYSFYHICLRILRWLDQARESGWQDRFDYRNNLYCQARHEWDVADGTIQS